MTGKIYLRQADGTLRGMREAPFDNEEILQRLLADYPDLLAGEQMDAESPRRWLLVARELGVPGEAGGGDRWSLDHLFLDQEGIPTLVEVKRSSDTRLRREVVGQMLDYAANAVVYWPLDALRTAFPADRESFWGGISWRGLESGQREWHGAEERSSRRWCQCWSFPTGRKRSSSRSGGTEASKWRSSTCGAAPSSMTRPIAVNCWHACARSQGSTSRLKATIAARR